MFVYAICYAVHVRIVLMETEFAQKGAVSDSNPNMFKFSSYLLMSYLLSALHVHRKKKELSGVCTQLCNGGTNKVIT